LEREREWVGARDRGIIFWRGWRAVVCVMGGEGGGEVDLSGLDEETKKELETLRKNRGEILERVGQLKTDLVDWRNTLDKQVGEYREELTGLRSTLNTEVESLRAEFTALRESLRAQLEEGDEGDAK